MITHETTPEAVIERIQAAEAKWNDLLERINRLNEEAAAREREYYQQNRPAFCVFSWQRYGEIVALAS